MYQVKFFEGDYYARQLAANQAGAVAYVEHHFNSSSSTQASYAVVVVGANASQVSRNWGRWYAKAIAEQFGIAVGGDQGILVGGWNGRGDGNLKHTQMPAVLLEPLFASHPQQADLIRSDSGQAILARILAESIRRFFPQGGLIAFSVGHKYKTSQPNDRGADLAGGGSEDDKPGPRKLRLMRGDQLLFETVVDEDAVLSWSPDRNLLFIPD